MTDPTREELLAFLETAYPISTGGELPHPGGQEVDGCGCHFDIEEAAYYVAAHCHGGQGSNLYAALSNSAFRPGPISMDLPDDEHRPVSSDLYRHACEWVGAKVEWPDDSRCPTCGATDPWEPKVEGCVECAAALEQVVEQAEIKAGWDPSP